MKAKRVRKLDPEAPLVDNAARIIRVRLGELRGFAAAARDPRDSRAQHDMRIAAKRLRYVLETTGFVFGAAADTARRRARDIQDVLGDLHDCDVMLPRIDQQIEQLRAADAVAVRRRAGDAGDLPPQAVADAPNRTAYRGLELLAVHMQARRALLFDRFVELWDDLERRRVWDRLERSIDRVVDAARERRAAAERASRAESELERARRAEREAAERAGLAAAELDRVRGARPAAGDGGAGPGLAPDARG